MAQLALGAAGAAVGFAIAGPAGAKWGWAIGTAAGGVLFGPKLPDGPRLQDKKVTVSTYGTEIPRLYGTARLAGNVIWSTDLQERAKKEGGKGGPTYTTYSYSVSCAVSVCLGPITGVRKIWADSLLIYDASIENDGPQRNFSASAFRVYLGTESQTVDPTIQAAMGNTPAYRGQAYVVFENLELEKFGNRIPNFTFEAINGNQEPRTWKEIVDTTGGGRLATLDPETGYLWVIADAPATINVVDPISKTLIATLQGSPVGDGVTRYYENLTYVPEKREFWGVTGSTTINPGQILPEDPVHIVHRWNANIFSQTGVFYTKYTGIGSFGQTYIYYNPAAKQFITGSTLGLNDNIFIYDENFEYIRIIDLDHYGSEGKYIKTSVDSLTGSENGIFIIGDGTNYSFFDAKTMTLVKKIVNMPDSIPTIGGEDKIAYDPTRNRLIWIGGGTTWCIIDVTTLQHQFITVPLPSGVVSYRTIQYHTATDKLIVAPFIGAGITAELLIFNAETFEFERKIVETGTTGGFTTLVDIPWFDDRIFDGRRFLLGTQYYLTDALSVATIPLDQVVLAESAIVDLDSSKIDVTDLAGETVYGYAVTSAGTIRGSLEPLMIAYQFDAVESNGKIKFVLRENAPTIVIDDEDIAYHDFGTETPDTLPITRSDEIELPRSVTIKYSNPSADYQIGSQASYRLSGNTKNDLMIELPVVMYDQQAKDIADIALYSAWAARSKAQVQTSIKYANVEPTDLVLVQGNLIRVTSKELRGNIVALNGEFENGQIYTQNSIAPSAFPVGQSFGFVGNTNLVFMDIPMLRDQDNNSGFYLAASTYGQVWDGCLVFKSLDGGTSWVEIAQIFNKAVIGAVENVLQPYNQNTIDNINTIVVGIKTSDELNSTNIEGLLNQSNAALVGNEIIQFKTATQISDNKYLLSGLLRGRRGSSTEGHIVGERFVLLEESSVIRVVTDPSETGLQRAYKAVTVGKTLDSAATLSFTNTDNCLECYSPVKLAGGRDSAGNLRISWVRRTRIGGFWRNFVDVPVGEESESYSVEIYDSGTLVRTINSTTTNATYSAADQTTDFGAPQSSVDVVVYQNSATNGPGFTISGSV
jgi:hypothetical protein